jgi:hypothetical protein
MLSPALLTVFLFQFVAIWNNFMLPLIMLQDPALYPLTYGLFWWQLQVSYDPALQTLTIVGGGVWRGAGFSAAADRHVPRSPALLARWAHRGVKQVTVLFDGIALGFDYNPEQWPRELWRDDVALMWEAGGRVCGARYFLRSAARTPVRLERLRLVRQGRRAAARRQ